MGNANTTTICPKYPQCCGDLNFLEDADINQTFAATNWYCYKDGRPPNWTNTTNITGIIFDSPITNNTDQQDFEAAYEKFLRDLAEQKRLFIEIPIMISQISGALSIFCCTIVIGIFIGILIYQPVIARRCSLRLSVAVSIADMIFSYNQAIPANYFNDWRCTAQASVQVWAELCSLFFTSSIALNLLLVFVFEFNNTKSIEPFYYACPLLLATILVAYPLYKNWFGYDRENCFFRYDINDEYNLYTGLDKYNAKVQELIWYAEKLTLNRIFYTSWMCASIIWCAIVVVAFWVSISAKNRKKSKAASKLGTSSQGAQSTTSGMQSTFKASSNATGTESSTGTALASNTSSSGRGSKGKKSASGHGTNKIEEKSQKMIQKAVMRIAFYPVVPLVCALPLALALSIMTLTKTYQFGWFSSLMSNLQGFGNACIFYFDPAVALARETFRKYMTEKYVIKYHPVGYDGQRSKTPVLEGNKFPFMYYFAKVFCSRKKDFVVENAKKKAMSKASTAVASKIPQTKKNALMEDDNADQNYNYSKVDDATAIEKVDINIDTAGSLTTGTMMTESFGEAATQSIQYDNKTQDVAAIQILEQEEDEEDEEDDVDEIEVLKDIQNF